MVVFRSGITAAGEIGKCSSLTRWYEKLLAVPAGILVVAPATRGNHGSRR